MASVVINGDSSGAVTLQAPAVAGTTTLTLPTTTGTIPVLPSTTGVLAEASGGTGTTTGYYGFKNRIINGAMMIDQRNAGASVTPTVDLTYLLDRWLVGLSQASKFSVQQNAGSVTPPIGFSNYLGFTSLSAYSVAAGESFRLSQRVEGFNFSDCAWGTASAATVTLSFWVRSSLTGTFGGSLTNSAQNYSYPFTFTISSANTWEQKTVTVSGPTAGTWIGGTNGIGVILNFNLGTGATYSGTAGSWSANTYLSATGATSVVGTNGATFYITGVQLEKGSTATSFDYRPYGTELALCQRYYEKSFNESVAPVQNGGTGGVYSTSQTVGASTTQYAGSVKFSTSKRAAPTVTLFNPSATNAQFRNVNTGTDCTNSASSAIGTNGFELSTTTPSGSAAGQGLRVHWTAEIEL